MQIFLSEFFFLPEEHFRLVFVGRKIKNLRLCGFKSIKNLGLHIAYLQIARQKGDRLQTYAAQLFLCVSIPAKAKKRGLPGLLCWALL
jgi:hypothetical protein